MNPTGIRNTVGTLGVVSIAMGALFMATKGQLNSVCGSSVAASHDPGCTTAAMGYYGGAALMVLGLALLVGAFVLSLGIEGRSGRHRRASAGRSDRDPDPDGQAVHVGADVESLVRELKGEVVEPSRGASTGPSPKPPRPTLTPARNGALTGLLIASPALPGWYDDPLHEADFRWWNGSQWTESVHPPAVELSL